MCSQFHYFYFPAVGSMWSYWMCVWTWCRNLPLARGLAWGFRVASICHQMAVCCSHQQTCGTRALPGVHCSMWNDISGLLIILYHYWTNITPYYQYWTNINFLWISLCGFKSCFTMLRLEINDIYIHLFTYLFIYLFIQGLWLRLGLHWQIQ